MAMKALSATASADGVCAARAHITVFESLVSGGSVAVAWRYFRRGIDGLAVEIRAIDNIGGQLDAAYGLLLNLLPNLPANAERRPSKQRKVRRGKRVRA